MSAALVAVVPSWPKALDIALVIVVTSLGATPAFAAPEWGITMTHANAYGLQAHECPTGKEEYLPGESEKDCGVDPFAGSGTAFAQESGFNTYHITVTNTAIGGAKIATCGEGAWTGEPTFTYEWLSGGVPIEGATGSTYAVPVRGDWEQSGRDLRNSQWRVGRTSRARVSASCSHARRRFPICGRRSASGKYSLLLSERSGVDGEPDVRLPMAA